MAPQRAHHRLYCFDRIITMFTSLFNDLKMYYAARHEPESMRPLAEVYWRVLLLVGLVMVAAVLLYGASEFFGVIANLSSDGPAKSRPAATLNRNQLEGTLRALQGRRQNFDALPATTIPDPSK